MGTIAALAINPSLYDNLPFDPERDLAPVTQAWMRRTSCRCTVGAGQLGEGAHRAGEVEIAQLRFLGRGRHRHLAGELFT